MRRNGLILLEFYSQPEGTHYRSGHRSWVPEGEAQQYIEDGLAKEHEPEPEEQPEPQPEIDLPAVLPGRTHFIQEEVYSFDEIKELANEGELQSVTGIGQSTETKILTFIGE